MKTNSVPNRRPIASPWSRVGSGCTSGRLRTRAQTATSRVATTDLTAAWKMGLTPRFATLMEICANPQRKHRLTTMAMARASRVFFGRLTERPLLGEWAALYSHRRPEGRAWLQWRVPWYLGLNSRLIAAP